MSHNSPTPGHGQAIHPIADDDGDNDSTTESEINSTVSVNSRAYEFRKSHGRTYETFRGDYFAANDRRQNDCREMNHEMLLVLNDNKLFYAPITTPREVLDAGTGTGIWAIECADCFPSAAVTGVDLSPTQPEFVPPNCRFELDDLSEDWTFRDNRFSFIHIRGLVGAISDLTSFYRQAYRCTEPGGWIEHADVSAEIALQGRSIPADHVYASWNRFVRQAGEKTGKTFNPIAQNAISMKEAGWVDVQTKKFRVPIGLWPRDPQLKQVGLWNKQICRDGLRGFAFQLGINVLSLDEKEMDTFLEEMVKAFDDRKLLAYYEYSHTWARKPLEGEAVVQVRTGQR